jgi:WD40 repeat protein
LWSSSSWQLSSTFQHPASVGSIAWKSDGVTIASSDNDGESGRFLIWDSLTNSVLLEQSMLYALDIEWKPNTNIVALASGGGPITLWDTVTGNQIQIAAQIATAKWNFDTSLIAIANQRITIADPSTLQTISEWPNLGVWINEFDWRSDGQQLATASDDGLVRIWDAATGQVTRIFSFPTQLMALDWSPDGNKIAVGGEDGVLHIIDLTSTATPTPNPNCTLTVNTPNGITSAIRQANQNSNLDTICLDSAVSYSLTCQTSEGNLPIITSPITIQGNGATVTCTVGGPTLLQVAASGSLTLQNVTVVTASEDYPLPQN